MVAKDKFGQIKEACNSRNNVYLLMDRQNCNAVRMAWALSSELAWNYFDSWYREAHNSILNREEFFIVQVDKASVL